MQAFIRKSYNVLLRSFSSVTRLFINNLIGGP